MCGCEPPDARDTCLILHNIYYVLASALQVGVHKILGGHNRKRSQVSIRCKLQPIMLTVEFIKLILYQLMVKYGNGGLYGTCPLRWGKMHELKTKLWTNCIQGALWSMNDQLTWRAINSKLAYFQQKTRLLEEKIEFESNAGHRRNYIRAHQLFNGFFFGIVDSNFKIKI